MECHLNLLTYCLDKEDEWINGFGVFGRATATESTLHVAHLHTDPAECVSQ